METIKDSTEPLAWPASADGPSERSQNELSSSAVTLSTVKPTTQSISSSSLSGQTPKRGTSKLRAPQKKRFPTYKADLRKMALENIADMLIAKTSATPPSSLASALCASPHSALSTSLCAPLRLLASVLCAPPLLTSVLCAPPLLMSAVCAPPPQSALCSRPTQSALCSPPTQSAV